MNGCCRSSIMNNVLSANTSNCPSNSFLPTNNASCNNQNVLGVQDTCTNENMLDSLCCCIRQKMYM